MSSIQYAAILLLSTTIVACGSSKGDHAGTGLISGTVKSALYPGIPPSDGEKPEPIVTPMANVSVTFVDSLDGNPVDTVVTDADGRFEARLPVGRYRAMATEIADGTVPMTTPDPVPFSISEEVDAVIHLRYRIYAP